MRWMRESLLLLPSLIGALDGFAIKIREPFLWEAATEPYNNEKS